jgi:hypothetical protein
MMALGRAPAAISATWGNLNVTFGAGATANNEDRTITFGSGSRTIKNSWASGGTLEYRIDSGSWTTYTEGGAGFSLNHNQTLAWRYTGGGNASGTAAVTVNGVALDDFTINASGWP